ncbi:hypothetical protein BCF46_2822 [Litoreibacter meonggei]|uniref:Uncharacterized protein n=1 Tax=Litoreibacter meonggei TaxID=1049199 RepID=A0A497VEV2_9RHOB|nr:hypothetical protein [Litoreibacter meonggei]RLJ41852.1 hypothetical protein BCF46_2822 [Litoreibacter meonggei]
MKTAILAIFAAAVSTAPAFAVEAMRCNVQTSPGVYQPVLRIVTQGDSRDIRMGSEGLTRKIFYRDRRVVAYLANAVGVAPHDLPRHVSRVCGAVEEATARAAPTAAAIAVAPPPAASETVAKEVSERPTDDTSDEAVY